ncbi:Bis(5'-nucleosyl)-tetraphosphatase, symmetrical [Fulvia fulva]|uniref:Bis(5'-nucleosyl)-tetraphosphatase, symmetrical n=1 Tax=Passalora fulva TaxID=5499 RepID=A0A9Q8LIH1_PASFU|nr:Bis(5'-nucleosyl)-tetraphosphatase, symmetrical [Fulvia fulva]KAK4625158.1 Bis(5'-nucleosyl)-tetraphosphatase, symmetrical [Fulvia fulva]UJO18011.1 Bis(5'-nucleosyl)-tetraphosphatase, symmetrical [Fulvia fulva]
MVTSASAGGDALPKMRTNDEEHQTLRQYQARLQASKPLIDQVSNQWKNEKTSCEEGYTQEEGESGFCDLDNAASCPNITRDLAASRRFRRKFAYAAITLLAVYYLWSRYWRPKMAVDWAYREGFVSQSDGTYGIARGGDLDPDLVRIRELDHELLPGGKSDPDGKRRLVFVGDVHGCKKELWKLLDKVDFREDTDHLVLVGDIISKGPDNVGVLDELIRLKATSVRGNHEDRILQVARSLDTGAPPPSEKVSSKGHSKDAALLRELKPPHLKYLRDMPLMLHIPSLPMALSSTKKHDSPIKEHILVVHAGLVPGVALNKQDPYFVMNMRSINRRTHVPSATRAPSKQSKPWFDIWNWYNDHVYRKKSMRGFNPPGTDSSEEDTTAQDSSSWFLTTLWKNFWGKKKLHPNPQIVIYGHDSKQGLQIERWSKGLDSGCVGGGELTALVLDARGRQELHSVGCKNYRD